MQNIWKTKRCEFRLHKNFPGLKGVGVPKSLELNLFLEKGKLKSYRIVIE